MKAASESTRTAYGYCRVSTNEQALAEGTAALGMSIEAQKTAIRRYFEYRLAEQYSSLEVLEEAGSSAEKMDLIRRPEGCRLPGLLRRGDCLIVTRMDRGFRNPADLSRMLEVWDKQGITLHLLDLNMDTSTATGKLIAFIMSAVAQWENATRRTRVMESNAQRRAQGLPVGSNARWGYKIVKVKDHATGRIVRRFVKDHETRAWAQRFVQLRQHGFTDYRGRKIAGPSFRQIAIYLLYQGVQLPSGIQVSGDLVWSWYRHELDLQAAEAERQS